MNRIEEMAKAADIIKKLRPSYDAILDFYSRVFQAQALSREALNVPAVEIDKDLLSIKKKNELPLIDPSEFKIDVDSAVKLFKVICDLAVDWAPHLAEDARAMKAALEEDLLEADVLYSALLNSQSGTIEVMARHIEVSQDHLGMFAYLSMAPSLEACAEQLSGYLEHMTELKKGYCPICGNHPDIAFLEEEGKRYLNCGFCGHSWHVNRLGCVFCDNTDKDQLQYFFSEEEKEYRVNLCDHCQNYIKVVDTRQMVRAFFPRLEMVSTLHLDMQAREKGYTSQASVPLD
ncbi:MAG: formate dehydrogenase accessory protein FdhE [Desulfobacteraceae bacterium]|nr:MAG: formate dehydrogenase accessory protein FdhE [Desulfobacteraceae bacterium]